MLYVGAVGASDDAVSCALMLEVLRVISQQNTPLKHNVIFIFNGAEENILQVVWRQAFHTSSYQRQLHHSYRRNSNTNFKRIFKAWHADNIQFLISQMHLYKF